MWFYGWHGFIAGQFGIATTLLLWGKKALNAALQHVLEADCDIVVWHSCSWSLLLWKLTNFSIENICCQMCTSQELLQLRRPSCHCGVCLDWSTPGGCVAMCDHILNMHVYNCAMTPTFTVEDTGDTQHKVFSPARLLDNLGASALSSTMLRCMLHLSRLYNCEPYFQY